jgi:hypothetical protein
MKKMIRSVVGAFLLVLGAACVDGDASLLVTAALSFSGIGLLLWASQS